MRDALLGHQLCGRGQLLVDAATVCERRRGNRSHGVRVEVGRLGGTEEVRIRDDAPWAASGAACPSPCTVTRIACTR